MPIYFFSKLGCEGSYFFFNCQIINRLLLIKSFSEPYNYYNPKTTPKPKMTPPGAITFKTLSPSEDILILSF